jgi:hypothetical protein
MTGLARPLGERHNLPGAFPSFPLGNGSLAYGHVLDELADGKSHEDGRVSRRDVHVDDTISVDCNSDRLIAESNSSYHNTRCLSLSVTRQPLNKQHKSSRYNSRYSPHFETLTAPAQTPAGLVGDAAAACCPDSTVASPSRDPFVMGVM